MKGLVIHAILIWKCLATVLRLNKVWSVELWGSVVIRSVIRRLIAHFICVMTIVILEIAMIVSWLLINALLVHVVKKNSIYYLSIREPIAQTQYHHMDCHVRNFYPVEYTNVKVPVIKVIVRYVISKLVRTADVRSSKEMCPVTWSIILNNYKTKYLKILMRSKSLI
jgi:hypothetical protein